MWKMTPFKIITLFKIHKAFNPDQFIQEKQKADIDDILAGVV